MTAVLASVGTVSGQQVADPGFSSVGRGAAVKVDLTANVPAAPPGPGQLGAPPAGQAQTPEQRAAALRAREPYTVGPVAQRVGGGGGVLMPTPGANGWLRVRPAGAPSRDDR